MDKFPLEDQEIMAISLVKIPGGTIGEFNYSTLKMKIKNGQVFNVQMSPPNMKQIAVNESKIAFMKTFFLEDVEAEAKEQAKEYFEKKEKEEKKISQKPKIKLEATK